MQEQTQKLRDRLKILLEQVERDRDALREDAEQGKTACSKLFDSLTATLHNLDRPAKVEQTL